MFTGHICLVNCIFLVTVLSRWPASTSSAPVPARASAASTLSATLSTTTRSAAAPTAMSAIHSPRVDASLVSTLADFCNPSQKKH